MDKINERKVPTWLRTGEFTQDMLRSFMDFYNDVIDSNSQTAIIYIDIWHLILSNMWYKYLYDIII